MRRHFQCVEQVKSPSNLTKYCACHEILKLKIWAETPWSASANRKTIRPWSDHVPRIIRAWNRHLAPAASGTFPVWSWRRFCKIQHFALRLSPKMLRTAAPATKSHPPTSPNTAPATQKQCHQWSASLPISGASKVNLEPYQILHLPRKMNVISDLRQKWNVISNAQSKQSHRATSPNTAPATQSESHDWSGSQLKHHLQCAEQAKSTSNLTKYCTCHAKWMSSVICVRNVTSFPMRRASKVTVQPHRILRLPRKVNLMIDPGHIWNVIYNARSKQSQPRTSPNTAPATQNECHQWSASEM